MPNPFFSGRIPTDLYERVEQYISETGESKTQVLINALAAYLNHPITKPASNLTKFEERFKVLEKRVETLEALFNKVNDKSYVVNGEDEKSKSLEETNTYDNTDNEVDNRLSVVNKVLENLWEENIDNNSNSGVKNTLQYQEEPVKLLPEYIPSKLEIPRNTS